MKIINIDTSVVMNQAVMEAVAVTGWNNEPLDTNINTVQKSFIIENEWLGVVGWAPQDTMLNFSKSVKTALAWPSTDMTNIINYHDSLLRLRYVLRDDQTAVDFRDIDGPLLCNPILFLFQVTSKCEAIPEDIFNKLVCAFDVFSSVDGTEHLISKITVCTALVKTAMIGCRERLRFVIHNPVVRTHGNDHDLIVGYKNWHDYCKKQKVYKLSVNNRGELTVLVEVELDSPVDAGHISLSVNDGGALKSLANHHTCRIEETNLARSTEYKIISLAFQVDEDFTPDDNIVGTVVLECRYGELDGLSTVAFNESFIYSS